VGLYSPVSGMTENVSLDGAFIKTRDLAAFQSDDQVVVTLFIPPDFSGQKKIISLQGAATITRVNQKNGGVAVHFDKILKQFERTDSDVKPSCSD